MGRKRIGFFQGNNNDDDTDNGDKGKDPFLKFLAAKKGEVKQFIEASYTPDGSTAQKEFKTSAELVYIWRESFDVSINILNDVMKELGYQLIFIDQVPNWVLYSKQTLNDD